MTFKTWCITIALAILLWVVVIIGFRHIHNKLDSIACPDCKIYEPNKLENLG